MLPPGSDAEWLLHESGAGVSAGTEDPGRIAGAIVSFWEAWRKGTLRVATDEAWLRQFHRRELTGNLVRLMDEILADRGNRNQTNTRERSANA
jgi:hypothetical protein